MISFFFFDIRRFLSFPNVGRFDQGGISCTLYRVGISTVPSTTTLDRMFDLFFSALLVQTVNAVSFAVAVGGGSGGGEMTK